MPRRIRTVLFVVLALVTLALARLILFDAGRMPSSSAPLPNPNGYDDFLKAGAAVTGDLARTSDLDELHALVATNSEALRLLSLGLTRRSSLSTVSAITNFGATMHDLPKFKALALLLEVNGRLAELEHRPAEAAANYVKAMRLGNEMSRGGFVIHRLVGVACQAIGSRSLTKLLPTLTCEEARPFIPELQELDASAVTWDEVSRNERAFSRYELRKSYNPFKPIVAWWQSRLVIRRAETRHDMAMAHVRLMALEAALRCYISAHRHAPASLQELVPEYLDHMPDDPFNGRPLIYRGQGTNWLLYSVGPDGVDDHGKRVGRGPESKGDLFFDSPW